MPLSANAAHLRRAFILAVVLAAPAAAHHSHNNYAISEFTNLDGVVKEVHLINPHSWVYIEVKDEKGEPQLWALEATGPNGLQRNGIKREDVKVGDTVRVRCHKLRDGSAGCLLGFLTPTHGDAARGHGVEKEWD
jgi:hypothetical protein